MEKNKGKIIQMNIDPNKKVSLQKIDGKVVNLKDQAFKKHIKDSIESLKKFNPDL